MTADTAARPIPSTAADPAHFLSQSGIKRLESIVHGQEAHSPMLQILGVKIHAWSDGHVELRAVPQARFHNFMNTVHGGWALTLLDTSMGLASLTTLLPGEFAPTLETTAKFVRPIVAGVGELRILGDVVSRGRRVVTLDGRVEDATGKLYAHGTSSCLISAWRG